MSNKLNLSELSPSLKYSIRDGIFFAIMFGAGESYLAAYGVKLGLSSLLIGMLSTLPLFIGSMSQMLGVKFMEQNISRRTIIVYGVRAQALSWLLIAALPWLTGTGSLTHYLLIIAVILYSSAGQIVVPAWTSLMGDLVPATMRGKYFGTRNQILGYFVIGSFIVVGYLLNLAQVYNSELYAFSLVFIAAAIARFISAEYLQHHDDPEYLFTPDDRFTLWQFIKRTRQSNFTRFVFFYASLNFGLFAAGPYFVVYMLRELNFSYLEFSIVSVSALATNYLSMRFWGVFGDRYGNRLIIIICSVYITLGSVLWLVSSSIPYLIVLQLVSGAAIAGIQFSAVNFLLDAVTPGKRGRCAAYMNFITASFIISGSLAGAALIDLFEMFKPQLAEFNLSPLATLFIVVSVLRIIIVASLLPRFREVRKVEAWVYSQRFYKITEIIPAANSSLQLILGMFRNRLDNSEEDAEQK